MISTDTKRSELLLHCIGHASALACADGGDLRVVVEGDLAAMVTPVLDRRSITAPDTAELLRYQRRIGRIHAAADVLPMRFGSVLAGEDAVRAHLRERRRDYLGTLDRVAGCAEMGLRALVPADAPAPDGMNVKALSGTEYLKARLRRHAWEEHLGVRCAVLERSILAVASAHCREHRVERPHILPNGAQVSVSFLVLRDRVPALRDTLAQLVTTEAGRGITGPWPPYNFV
ncbi:GvpL/GvpF family gas vesicle protein [Polyangium aurulentum]|uniref:GvpL/GvpF family gas vesicle protein n=1 Tax=Polyangium aurulentum TaxID=2567896 RepID=UPI00146BA890|nr:GvpL/GvpF family gas vesicle protein [Polyangium aurulentum]UQA57618.1 GvpL/GvpF family gas vesicle protein [Polyangium aurulentum]